jgi:hypothetical protein
MSDATFGLQEHVSLEGRQMSVAGIAQYEDAGGEPVTRYVLSDGSGPPQVVEQDGLRFALLRPLPPEAQPGTAGDTVTVLDEKYTLVKVRKLTLLATSGKPPGNPPRGSLLLSGLLQGQAGALVREIEPGRGGQTYFALKPLPPEEVLNGEQLANLREQVRAASDARTRADEDAEDLGQLGAPHWVAFWAAIALAVAGLALAYLRG